MTVRRSTKRREIIPTTPEQRQAFADGLGAHGLAVWVMDGMLRAALSEDRAAAFHEDESAGLADDRRRAATSTHSADWADGYRL